MDRSPHRLELLQTVCRSDCRWRQDFRVGLRHRRLRRLSAQKVPLQSLVRRRHRRRHHRIGPGLEQAQPKVRSRHRE